MANSSLDDACRECWYLWYIFKMACGNYCALFRCHFWNVPQLPAFPACINWNRNWALGLHMCLLVGQKPCLGCLENNRPFCGYCTTTSASVVCKFCLELDCNLLKSYQLFINEWISHITTDFSQILKNNDMQSRLRLLYSIYRKVNRYVKRTFKKIISSFPQTQHPLFWAWSEYQKQQTVLNSSYYFCCSETLVALKVTLQWKLLKNYIHAKRILQTVYKC